VRIGDRPEVDAVFFRVAAKYAGRAFVAHYCDAHSHVPWDDTPLTPGEIFNARHILARGSTHLPYSKAPARRRRRSCVWPSEQEEHTRAQALTPNDRDPSSRPDRAPAPESRRSVPPRPAPRAVRLVRMQAHRRGCAQQRFAAPLDDTGDAYQVGTISVPGDQRAVVGELDEVRVSTVVVRTEHDTLDAVRPDEAFQSAGLFRAAGSPETGATERGLDGVLQAVEAEADANAAIRAHVRAGPVA
jgi:hypothetical protein